MPEQGKDRQLQAGTLPCSFQGCQRLDAVACGYVDRRHRPCRTAWCPEHQTLVGGNVYCRRHAGTVAALPLGAANPQFPDLDNRAPSLVSWVAREVDQGIRSLLEPVARQSGVHVVIDPVFLIFAGVERERVWERAWKVPSATGNRIRVALQVEELADTEVCIKVNSRVMGRLVPPWISLRIRGEVVPPAVDDQRRSDFNARIIELIGQGMEQELVLASQLREPPR